MKKLNSSFKRKKQLSFVTTSLLILALLLISPAAASVSEWDFSPKELVSGETLSLTGSASPGEKVDVFVNFEKTVPVSGGKFEYILENVKIPEGSKNLFKVEATGAKKLNVRVKMVIWITKSSDASGNTAIVSQSNVPPGTYAIRIDGDAVDGVSDVNLKITASQEIEANSNGDFSYSYNTKSIPPGEFDIKVGDKAKEISILPEGFSGSAYVSTSGSTRVSTSSSLSGSNSTPGPSTTGTSSEKTDGTGSQLVKTPGSGSSSAGPLPENTASYIAPGNSKDVTGVDSGTSGLDKNVGEKDTQSQLSKEGLKPPTSTKSSVNFFYILMGVGVGTLISLIYLITKRL